MAPQLRQLWVWGGGGGGGAVGTGAGGAEGTGFGSAVGGAAPGVVLRFAKRALPTKQNETARRTAERNGRSDAALFMVRAYGPDRLNDN